MDQGDIQTVSHSDLYHKLGKLEGLMQTMMESVTSFRDAMKDIHSRMDSIEARQAQIENSQSKSSGARTALFGAAKDFAIPLMAIAVTWLVAKNEVSRVEIIRHPLGGIPHHSTYQTPPAK